MAIAYPHPAHRRVLVIDGGGFRGLGCLVFIDSLMKAVKARSRQSLLPCEVFDLICGTSSGGLIAILLGRLGLDCHTAIEVYKDLAAQLFGRDESIFWNNLLNMNGFETDAFDEALANLAKTYGGNAGLPMQVAVDGPAPKTYQYTQTFVTAVSDAPDYDNRTHIIRSYPAPKGGRSSLPRNHKWLVQEAARATLATRMYMQPLLLSNTYGFQDAGFAGFNNPIDLAHREVERLWMQEKPGLVVSLGTGLSILTPQSRQRDWVVTDLYAKKYADEMVSKLKPSMQTELSQATAVNIVKNVVTIALDSESSHLDMVNKIPEHIYFRVNPSLDLTSTDLVDLFQASKVERAVKDWVNSDEGGRYIFEISSKLVELNTEPLTAEQAGIVAPPPPPKDTAIGYNPQLDKPRPDTMIDYLTNYHVFFIIDDSGSMKGARWMETRDALIDIAEYALEYNTKEVDLRFFNSPVVQLGVQGKSIITNTFIDVQPRGYTPTGAVLKKVLDDHIAILDGTINTPEYKKIKPLDIIVLTDGVPSDKPKDVLVDAVRRMKSSKHHPNSVGVQFVQIGNDPEAVEVLKGLMHGAVGSMVDTVPYDGLLTPKKLQRILLGGLHPNVRAMLKLPTS